MAICPQHTEINLVPSPRALPGSMAHNETSKPMSVIMPAMFRKRATLAKIRKVKKTGRFQITQEEKKVIRAKDREEQ